MPLLNDKFFDSHIMPSLIVLKIFAPIQMKSGQRNSSIGTFLAYKDQQPQDQGIRLELESALSTQR